jgi:hypothetical protein
MSQAARIVRQNPGTLHRELQGEGVLLQLDTGEYFGLDDVAQRMWALIVEHGDLEVVQARLLDEFDVEPDTLSGDLHRFVGELIERRLLDAVDPPAR